MAHNKTKSLRKKIAYPRFIWPAVGSILLFNAQQCLEIKGKSIRAQQPSIQAYMKPNKQQISKSNTSSNTQHTSNFNQEELALATTHTPSPSSSNYSSDTPTNTTISSQQNQTSTELSNQNIRTVDQAIANDTPKNNLNNQTVELIENQSIITADQNSLSSVKETISSDETLNSRSNQGNETVNNKNSQENSNILPPTPPPQLDLVKDNSDNKQNTEARSNLMDAIRTGTTLKKAEIGAIGKNANAVTTGTATKNTNIAEILQKIIPSLNTATDNDNGGESDSKSWTR
ncbi:WH2 domain-containing protein [Cardinium endosymbiont of Tipula unca]|uniref:WH2 domain-containing protein n=1 Tax=Cardinium endosymbiont of Tipula unca TaxID=3066216 RepID=UPI0030CB76C9